MIARNALALLTLLVCGCTSADVITAVPAPTCGVIVFHNAMGGARATPYCVTVIPD